MLNSLICNSLLTTLITLSCSSPIVLAEPLMSHNFNYETLYLAQRDRSLRGERGFGQRRLLEQLNLTAEQKEEIEQIRQKYQQQITQTRSTLRAERDKLREMMTGNESTENLRSQHDNILNLDRQLRNLHFETMLEMREVLTLEQRQEFASIMDEKKANFRRRRDNLDEFQP